MYLAGRLQQLREAKELSQGDIEKRTGLRRRYISSVENGHTVPLIETLEKISRALEVPMYQLFYSGQGRPRERVFTDNEKEDWASQRAGQRLFMKLRLALRHTREADRKLILQLAKKMAAAKRKARH